MFFQNSKRISKNRRDLKIQHQNTEISFFKECVYLGNTVDSNLRMDTNFDCSYKKASGRRRLLQNVRIFLKGRLVKNHLLTFTLNFFFIFMSFFNLC